MLNHITKGVINLARYKGILFLLLIISLTGMQSPITKEEENNTSSLHTIPSIQMFYSGNIKGYLEPCGCKGKKGGGLARWATFIKENIDKDAQLNLILDSGYFVSYRKGIKKLKSEYILKAMAEIGYDAINLSEKDIYQIGKDTLLNLKEKYNLPFVSSNIFHIESKKLLTDPYIIKSNKEIKVGIFGLARQIKLEKEGLIIKDPIISAKEMVKLLKGRCNLIIALTQLNKEESLRLAKEVEGIDVIICGRFRLTKERVDKINHTLILQPGAKGDEGTSIKVYLDKEIVNFEEKYSDLEESIALDKEIVKIIDEYKKAIKEKQLSTPRPAFTRHTYAGAKRCGVCHQNQYDRWQKTRHAKAFYSLKKVKEDKNPECLKCHTTGFRQDNGFWDYKTTPDFANVGCEECHKLRIPHVTLATITPVDNEFMKISSTLGKVDSSTVCTKCHTKDKDPEFNFDEDKRKIAH
jgi:hypothetical protein